MIAFIIGCVLIIFFTIVLWLLYAPITLTVDTSTDDYSLAWYGVFLGQLKEVEGHLSVMIQAPFFRRRIDVVKKVAEQMTVSEKVNQKIAKGRGNQGNSKFILKRLRKNWLGILKSFDVKKFRMDVDTGNYTTNGLLVPISFFARQRGLQVRINFMGEQNIRLILRNRLARLFWALLK